MTIEELRAFHTERRGRNVTVTCEKSPVPMLWLDSSVLIDLAKIENKENIDHVRSVNLLRLKEIAHRAIREEKLICPEWDQSSEFEGKRLEKQIRGIVSDLSCGAHCVSYAGVKDQQMDRGLAAYLEGAETINIPPHIHFYRDPVQVIREAKRNRFIVEADMPKPVEWIEKAERDKNAIKAAWEKLRKMYFGEKQKFDQQLALERIGESDSMLAIVGDFMRSVANGKADFWGLLGVEGFFRHFALWNRLGGPSDGIAALYSFMRSPYYWELPIVDISCRLGADLMVKHYEVKSGDHQDIQHLATAIPVAHYIVADKAMVDRCERLGIDEKWGTKLYPSKGIDRLCKEIEGL